MSLSKFHFNNSNPKNSNPAIPFSIISLIIHSPRVHSSDSLGRPRRVHRHLYRCAVVEGVEDALCGHGEWADVRTHTHHTAPTQHRVAHPQRGWVMMMDDEMNDIV